MFDDPDLQSALEGSFAEYSAAQTYVVLPHDGAQRSYRVHSSGTREVAVLNTFDDDANLRPLPPGYARFQQTRVSESGTRALVVENDIDIKRDPMILTGVTVCDLTTGQPLHVLPGLAKMTRPGVLLLGDFAFVGGRGHRFWHLADPDRQEWTDLPFPEEVWKRTIDFYGVADRKIWAIDDIMAPLYAIAYAIDGGSTPDVHQIAQLINGTIVDFACNEFALAYLFAENTRSGHSRSCSVYVPRRHAHATNLAAGIRSNEVDPDLGALRAIALVDTTLVGAFEGVGLRTADLGAALQAPGEVNRTHWSAPFPTPNGEEIIALRSVPHTRRVYAIVNEEDPTWFGFSLRHEAFVESGHQVSPSR